MLLADAYNLLLDIYFFGLKQMAQKGINRVSLIYYLSLIQLIRFFA